MMHFLDFSEYNKILSVFETSKNQALIIDYKHPYLANYRLVIIANQKTRISKTFIVHKDVIAGAKSYSGLVKAIKDDDTLHQSIHDLYQSYLASLEQDKAPAKAAYNSPLVA